jgi:hypothetical protein
VLLHSLGVAACVVVHGVVGVGEDVAESAILSVNNQVNLVMARHVAAGAHGGLLTLERTLNVVDERPAGF